MRCFRTRGKKGEKHMIRLIHLGAAPTNSVGTGRTTTIGLPSSGLSGATVGNVACVCVTIPMARRCKSTSMDTPRRDTTCYTDEWQGYNKIKRVHHTVCHGQKEWARDDDGDGIREVHTNTIEGLWTTARNFLRPFRGVHKKYLHHYLAMCEHKINLKRISPKFIARLVTQHRSVT